MAQAGGLRRAGTLGSRLVDPPLQVVHGAPGNAAGLFWALSATTRAKTVDGLARTTQSPLKPDALMIGSQRSAVALEARAVSSGDEPGRTS